MRQALVSGGLAMLACLWWARSTPASTLYVRTDGSDDHSCREAEVDGNTSAKRSIQAAIDCLNKDSSGHMIVIGGGHYRESVQVYSSSRGDSWSNPNILKAADGETVWIVDAKNPLSVTDHIAPRDGGGTRPNQYWILERLRLTCEGAQGTALGSDNNPYIRYQSVEMTGCRRGFAGGGNYNEFLNMHAHHVGTNGCQVDAGQHTDCYGIYYTGSHGLIDGGSFHDIPTYCIHVYLGDYTNVNVTVRNVRACRCGTGVGIFNRDHTVLNSTFADNQTAIMASPGTRIEGNTIYGGGILVNDQNIVGNNTVSPAGGGGDVCAYDDSGSGPTTPPVAGLPKPTNFRRVGR